MWGLRDAHGLAVIGAGNSPCIIWAATAARCKHALHCDVSIGGAGDLLSIVGGIMTPEEFCFLTASHVEKVAGTLMLLSVGMFGPQDRTNKKQK